MDSINREQPEDPRRDLSGSAATEKIREMVLDAGTCFFCTSPQGSPNAGVRPMSVRDVDDRGRLWFLSAADSHKNAEVARDARVRLFFQGAKHSDFLQLDGHASVHRGRDTVDALWSPFLRTWFTGGKDDPRITAICVQPVSGYYWDTKHGNAIAGLKIMLGAATGVTLDDSLEGRLQPPAPDG